MGSIIVNSIVIWGEIIELTKTVPINTLPVKNIITKTFPRNFIEKKVALTTISFLIIVSIYSLLLPQKTSVVGSNPTRTNFLYGIEKP